MKTKFLTYAFIPVMGAGLLGINAASAHGLGGMGMGMFNSNVSPDDLAARHQTMFEAQANMLGLSVDDVKNAWAEGTSLLDLAKAKGLTDDQIKEKMKAAHEAQMKTHLKTLVDKGIITQAQADKRLAAMQNKAANMKMHGKKGRHMLRGMGF